MASATWSVRTDEGCARQANARMAFGSDGPIGTGRNQPARVSRIVWSASSFIGRPGMPDLSSQAWKPVQKANPPVCRERPFRHAVRGPNAKHPPSS